MGHPWLSGQVSSILSASCFSGFFPNTDHATDNTATVPGPVLLDEQGTEKFPVTRLL